MSWLSRAPSGAPRLLRRALLGASLLLAATLPVAAQPRTITDAAGRQVTLAGPAQRVVLGFYFEEFAAIVGPGAFDRVVGISRALWAGWRTGSWAAYTAVIPRIATLADVGTTDDNSFSAEKVIALDPDLVILPLWTSTAIPEAMAQFERLKIPVLVVDFNAQTVERHVASTLAIGAAMGTEARAQELASWYSEGIADIMRRIAAAPSGPKRRVYVELGQAGPATVGNSYQGTMWGRVITSLGAENVADGKLPGPWGPVNPEAVLSANPEVVIFAGSSWANRPNAVRTGFGSNLAMTRATLAPYAARPGWAGITAVQKGDVYAVEHGLGRSLYDLAAIQFFAKAIYPEQFADVDPEATLRTYFERWLPVKLDGTWMARLAP
jgi:ABC-type Fe3+-hydroxamate transport system substrate-binding protein